MNLGTGSARIFDIDEDGGTLSRRDGQELEGIRGHLSKASMARLTKATKKVCTVKKPDTEPMTFVRITAEGCRVIMTAEEWKPRAPELMKTIKALAEEACRGPCTVQDRAHDLVD